MSESSDTGDTPETVRRTVLGEGTLLKRGRPPCGGHQ